MDDEYRGERLRSISCVDVVHEDELQEFDALRHVMRAIVILLMDGSAQPALHGVFAKGRIDVLDSKHFPQVRRKRLCHG
jgi:hypothetical protein